MGKRINKVILFSMFKFFPLFKYWPLKALNPLINKVVNWYMAKKTFPPPPPAPSEPEA